MSDVNVLHGKLWSYGCESERIDHSAFIYDNETSSLLKIFNK